MTGTRQAINVNNWNSEEPLRQYNLSLAPGTNALVKVEVHGDNSNNNEYVGKYIGEFSARLFNSVSGDDFITSSGQSQRACFDLSPALNLAADVGGQPVPTPGGDTGIFTPGDGQQRWRSPTTAPRSPSARSRSRLRSTGTARGPTRRTSSRPPT